METAVLVFEIVLAFGTMYFLVKKFNKDVHESAVDSLESLLDPNVVPSVPNTPLTLNRATRRQMAKILRHHPDHKGITHASLPLECSELEYLYWQMCISEVELDKNKGEV